MLGGIQKMQGVRNTAIKRLILTIGLFSAIFGLVLGFGAIKDSQAATTGTFNVSLTISNSAPIVIWVNGSISESPTEGSTKVITVVFNVSDTNGASDINVSTANVTFNFSTEPVRGASNCVEQSSSGNVMTVECNITMNYYDLDGEWTINASIMDDSESYAQNLSETMTWGDLAAMTVTKSEMSFSGSPGDTNLAPTENPQVINNTGNQDFVSVNITGYELQGETVDTVTIGAGNFTVNVSDSAAGLGDQIINDTSIQITDASLSRGAAATEDIYLRMDIPSGIIPQDYSAVELWEISVSET